MKTTEYENNQNNQKAGFKRKRNQNEDVPESMNKIKKRVRDVQRMLKNKDRLPAQAITEAKRRLRTLQYELGEKIVDEKERKMAAKYHKAKHFERKKVQRKINQFEALLKEEVDEEKKKKIQSDLDEWKIKLLYTTNYPKTESYVSLFPQGNEDYKISVDRKTKVLTEIKKALEKGDSDLKEFSKSFRDRYKNALISEGIIVIEPLGDDEEGKEETKEEEEDDFFEK